MPIVTPKVECLHRFGYALSIRPKNIHSLVIALKVPIIAVALILSGFAALSWTKRHFRRTLASVTSSNTTANANSTRELTAEQLANGATQTPSGRRPRRNRRTPSQISTRSLPVYMKEPGDEELVIFRLVRSFFKSFAWLSIFC